MRSLMEGFCQSKTRVVRSLSASIGLPRVVAKGSSAVTRFARFGVRCCGKMGTGLRVPGVRTRTRLFCVVVRRRLDVRCQMNPQPLSFVYLRFSPRSAAGPESGIPLLVALKDATLEVFIRSGWEDGVAAEDREYLEELMSDWRKLSAGAIPGLLEQLAELSVGPLRAIESGILDARKRTQLLEQVHSGQPIR